MDWTTGLKFSPFLLCQNGPDSIGNTCIRSVKYIHVARDVQEHYGYGHTITHTFHVYMYMDTTGVAI